MPCDYSKYPPNWKTEIVPRVLDRAGDRCEACDIPGNASVYSVPLKIESTMFRVWVHELSDVNRLKKYTVGVVKFVKVVLTVAHLDHDETNHDVTDDRLMAMCQYCHLNYDAEEKARRRKQV